MVAGFALIGASGAISLLVRTAAGDMYPPERRARGISLVLFGSVFGAILGPAVFSPLFAGKHVDADALTIPWLAAAGLCVVALARGRLHPARPEADRRADRLGSAATHRPSRRRRSARSCAGPA